MMTWLPENWRLCHIRCEIRSKINGIGNVASYCVSSWDSWLLLSYLSWILRIFLVAKIVRLVMQSKSAPATCQPNIKQNIESHNKSTLQARMNINESQKLCNNRKPSDSPMNGPEWMACLRKSIAYQVTVTTEDSKPDETYVGPTWKTFKTRSKKHKTSFN